MDSTDVFNESYKWLTFINNWLYRNTRLVKYQKIDESRKFPSVHTNSIRFVVLYIDDNEKTKKLIKTRKRSCKVLRYYPIHLEGWGEINELERNRWESRASARKTYLPYPTLLDRNRYWWRRWWLYDGCDDCSSGVGGSEEGNGVGNGGCGESSRGRSCRCS